LEAKIQSLTSLLLSQQESMTGTLPFPQPLRYSKDKNGGCEPSQQFSHDKARSSDTWMNGIPSRKPLGQADGVLVEESFEKVLSQCQPIAPISASNTVNGDGEFLLKIYRDHFSIRFPFVIIPPNISASAFRSQKPWLYKAVTTVASQDRRAEQLRMGKSFMSEISMAMIIDGEKSLDMLQGLLICKCHL
jgi:hypothetical protein